MLVLLTGCGSEPTSSEAAPELVAFTQVTRADLSGQRPGTVRRIGGAEEGKQRLEGYVTGCRETHPPELVGPVGRRRLEYPPGTRSGVRCVQTEYYRVVYDVSD